MGTSAGGSVFLFFEVALDALLLGAAFLFGAALDFAPLLLEADVCFLGGMSSRYWIYQ